MHSDSQCIPYTFLKDHSKTAICAGDQKVSYQELLSAAYGMATALNIKEDDHVIIYAENSIEWIIALYAIWLKKAIAVPVDHQASADDLSYIINDATPTAIFYSNNTAETVQKSLDATPARISEILLQPQTYPLQQCDPIVVKDREKTGLIIYTSGTTGNPKGVMLSYENLITNVSSVSDGVPIFSIEETTMILLPLHHVLPLLGSMVAPLATGGKVAIAPAMSGDAIMRTLQDHAVTIMIGVPRLYEMICKGILDKINSSVIAKTIFSIAKSVKSKKLSHILFKSVHKKFGGAVKFMVCGGAALDPKVGEVFYTLGFDVLEGYGMTEAAPMITFTRPGDVVIGSPGKAVPDVDIEIRNGEICARGKNIMQGYYQRPEETDKVLKDGWLYTGDLGKVDENGYLWITGRKKEIIVLPNGKNINPTTIEQHMLDMEEALEEIGVFQDKGILQAIMRFNRAKTSTTPEKLAENLMRTYNEQTSPYKRVLKYHLVDEELPKTRLGKIRRFQLPELAHTKVKTDKTSTEPSYQEYVLLRDYLKKETGLDVSAEDSLEFDLGLDSLTRLSLLVYLENTFGIQIDENKLSSFTTVKKLSEYLKSSKKKIQDTTVNWSEILKEKVNLRLPKSWFTTRIFASIGRTFFKLYFRFKTVGTENIPDGPFILAPNHQSFMDGLLVAVNLQRKTLRNTYFYAKAKHVRLSWVKFLANRNNVIVMDLNNDLKGSIQKLAEVLRKGKNIIIFPEGTRSLDGSVGPFKQLFAILSKELQVPVVPVSINGAFEALPKGSKIPKPGKHITVEFLPPVTPEQQSYEQLADNIRTRISNKVEDVETV